MVQIHQQIHVFAKLGFGHDFMTIWGFILKHFGHMLGIKSASKSIPELDIHHESPMEASLLPMGTSGGRWVAPKSKGPWGLGGWDSGFGGTYMSTGSP